MDGFEQIPWAQARPRLENVSRFAFDLEGDFNLHHYGRKICLFQVALDDGTVFLLDPLAETERSTAWPGWKELIENPSVTKVIWAAQNDIRALKACHGLHLKGLWDLFDAACLTVTPRPSLPLLVEAFLGKSIEKAEALQTSDWSARPLAAEQLVYAAQDVRYLLTLADKIDPLLDQKKKREAFLTRMQTAEEYVFSEHPEPWRRLKGAGTLLPDELERLEAVWHQRETLARHLDLAPWRLVPTEELLHWAREERFSESFAVDPRWGDRVR
jgi:ribonuclease D